MSAERNAVLEEVAVWHAETGWLLDEADVPAAIRALKSADPAKPEPAVESKNCRKMLTDIGGWDNELINVPAGAVRKIIEEVESLRVAPVDQPLAGQDVRSVSQEERACRAEDALAYLVDQIKKTSPIDDHGHALKMNESFINAEALLKNIDTSIVTGAVPPTQIGKHHEGGALGNWAFVPKKITDAMGAAFWAKRAERPLLDLAECYEAAILAAQPLAGQDVRVVTEDAARYRWLRDKAPLLSIAAPLVYDTDSAGYAIRVTDSEKMDKIIDSLRPRVLAPATAPDVAKDAPFSP